MKKLIGITATTILLATTVQAQTYLSEDFESGIPTDWPVGITIPAVTTWHTLLPGECTSHATAAGFTGVNCQTGARGFPSGSFMSTPMFNLSGPPQYLLEFDSTLSMDLSFDTVAVSIVDDMGFPNLLLDGFALTNNGITERVSTVIPASFGASNISIQFAAEATSAGSGALGWIIDNVLIRSAGTGDAFCFGDGSGNGCPCGNQVPLGTLTGCLNSSGVGAELQGIGVASVSNDTLGFHVVGAPQNGFGILVSGDNQLPAPFPGIGISVFDGLRCTGGNLKRHGGRSMDATGANINPWGEGGNPVAGLIAQGGFGVGQTRHWQVFLRDLPTAICQSGRNFSNGISTTFVP